MSKPKLEQWQRVAESIDAGPLPAVDGVVRWRLADLAQWVGFQSELGSPWFAILGAPFYPAPAFCKAAATDGGQIYLFDHANVRLPDYYN